MIFSTLRKFKRPQYESLVEWLRRNNNRATGDQLVCHLQHAYRLYDGSEAPGAVTAAVIEKLMNFGLLAIDYRGRYYSVEITRGTYGRHACNNYSAGR